MQNVIKTLNEYIYPEKFEPWKYDKGSIKKICDILDKSYEFHSTLEGATVLLRMMQTLNDIFITVYNDHFEISSDC